MTPTLANVVRSLRPLQWMKNMLVFVPLVMSHRLDETAAFASAGLAFLAFCLAASGTYLLNDVRDVEHDRAHPAKSDRVVAAGLLAPAPATIIAVGLLAAGVAVSFAATTMTAVFLVAYVALNLLYSYVLKRRPVFDVLVLSALYTVRLLAGGAAAAVVLSDWLLAFSGAIFFGLALLKRYADLGYLAATGATEAPGRGYVVEDRDLLRSLGVASSAMAVLVFALYVDSEQSQRLYSSPRVLWLICPLLLYWITHMWMLAHRGEIRDDPIVVAARDPASYATAALIAVIAFAAS